MDTVSCWMTMHSVPGLENLGFNSAEVRAWLYNSINNDQMLLGQRFLDLGSSVINEYIPFLLDKPTRQLGCLHLLIEIIAYASVGRVDTGVGRVDTGVVCLPLQRLVMPGWVMPASPPIRSRDQGYPMCVLNVSLYTELPANGPANYPHPPAGPHAPYPNPGYPPVAPQQYQPPAVFGTIVSHFLGGIFGQIGNGAMNQDMFGNGFSIDDLIASFGTIVSDFLGGIFGQIGSGDMNQDMFGNGFSIDDLIASFFM